MTSSSTAGSHHDLSAHSQTPWIATALRPAAVHYVSMHELSWPGDECVAGLYWSGAPMPHVRCFLIYCKLVAVQVLLCGRTCKGLQRTQDEPTTRTSGSKATITASAPGCSTTCAPQIRPKDDTRWHDSPARGHEVSHVHLCFSMCTVWYILCRMRRHASRWQIFRSSMTNKCIHGVSRHSLPDLPHFLGSNRYFLNDSGVYGT